MPCPPRSFPACVRVDKLSNRSIDDRRFLRSAFVVPTLSLRYRLAFCRHYCPSSEVFRISKLESFLRRRHRAYQTRTSILRISFPVFRRTLRRRQHKSAYEPLSINTLALHSHSFRLLLLPFTFSPSSFKLWSLKQQSLASRCSPSPASL